MKKCFALIITIVHFISIINLYGSEENTINSLKYYKNNLVFTNASNNSINILSNGDIKEIVNGRGVGYYFNLNESQNKLGYKLIDEAGLQTPFVYDFELNKSIAYSNPVDRCGQVYINTLGTITFTIENELNIIKNSNQFKLDIGNYSNLTPISNNDIFVAYNDKNDQIWLLNLETSKRNKITFEEKGYFNPIFSPNSKYLLFQALNAEIYIYDLINKTSSFVGVGFSPSWANNSDKIVFYKKEISNDSLINTELYAYYLEFKSTEQLTNTPNVFEIDPIFNNTDSQIAYINLKDNCIFDAELSQNGIESVSKVFDGNLMKPIENQLSYNPTTISTLTIPYVNQVYDVPDWHSGYSSCAPTAAAMVLAYYKILPPWQTVCSYPSAHYNNYGRYVCERYRYREVDYNYSAGDYAGNPSKGGYGFMWSTGSPHTRMADYYRYHGLQATQTESPPHSEAVTEIVNEKPYTMCVGITTSGHLIIGHGFGNENHTLVFHDPYGNKNVSYPSYNGQNAQYDWPGYNNGFKNLNNVYWCIKTQYNLIIPVTDTLVDDLQYSSGFYMHTKYPSSMIYWYDKKTGGYRDHFWYVNSNSTMYSDKAYGTWTPLLSREGKYEIQVYIPYSTAKKAIYKVYAKDSMHVVFLDQASYSNQWVSLGVFPFSEGNTGYLRLGDASDTAGVQIVFDAARWIYNDSLTSIKENNENIIVSNFSVNQNYPNPFNPSTEISYNIPSEGHLVIQIFNNLGELIKVVKDDNVTNGRYSQTINLEKYSSGHFLINFLFTDQKTQHSVSKTIKSLLIK